MRYAKKSLLEERQTWPEVRLALELTESLERAYAAVALLDERLSGLAQFHTCSLGSSLERDLQQADLIRAEICRINGVDA